MKHLVKILFVTVALAISAGCASVPKEEGKTYDPYQNYNRKMHKFNRVADKILLKPVAKTYQTILPSVVRKGVTNFFNNLGTINTFLNAFLQGKTDQGFSDFSRFFVNSTAGIGGLFDPASHWGLEAHKEDFGQTLAVWGVEPGPYIVWPLFGPSNARDTSNIIVNNLASPLWYYDEEARAWMLWGLEIIDIRAQIGDIDIALDQALDSYIFEREAFYQHRRYHIYDGNPPVENDFDDFEFEDDL